MAGFFGFGKEEIQSQHERADAYSEVLDAMAREKEDELREGQDELLASFEHEQYRQSEGFSYCIKRHGDFLTIMLTRKGNQDSEWAEGKRAHTETINIGKVRSMRLKPGHAPDLKGCFGWLVSHRYEDEDGNCIGTGSSSGRPMGPPESGRHEVNPSWESPHLPSSRSFLEWEEGGSQRNGMHHIPMGGGVRYRTTEYPRPAKDDAIVFRGIGLSVFAPFGQGQELLDAIEAELANAGVNAA